MPAKDIGNHLPKVTPLRSLQFWLFILLILLPKSGIKIAGIPITTGYLLLAAATFYYFSQQETTYYTPLLGWQWVLAASFSTIGLLHFCCFGFILKAQVMSFVIHFIALPIAFFFVLYQPLSDYFYRWVNWIAYGVLALSLIGLLLWGIQLTTGKFIEVPLLTTNLGDVGTLADKCNDRGGIYKLFSTYNNGNLFGVCLLMLLPLHDVVVKQYRFILFSRLALAFTLSRTVWAGLIFYELVKILVFSTKKLRAALLLCTSFLFVIVLFFSYPELSRFFGFDFLFSSSLGNRWPVHFSYFDLGLINPRPFYVISEIAYWGVAEQLGAVGLFLYLLMMGFAPLYALFHWSSLDNLSKAIACGLINYAFLSLSDGCVPLIPTFALVWLLTTLFFVSPAVRALQKPLKTNQSNTSARLSL